MGPFEMHDLQNNNYSFGQFIELFEELVVASNFSAKIIYAPSRAKPAADILAYMFDAYNLSQVYPNTIIGFDIDGPEDEGHPLLFFIDEFLQVQNATNNGLRFYFHAGETVLANNTNLYDAILLNTTRIGHGFQLAKHPILLEDVKSRGICIEICPISNQILELVPDLRTHPAWEYFNQGIPIAISSDDPAIYGYEGISYDFYEVFMAWDLDLRGLKQLALNSIKYSTWLNAEQEKQVYSQFVQAWDAWIDNIANSF
jgi:adenosine deaminase CECR1